MHLLGVLVRGGKMDQARELIQKKEAQLGPGMTQSLLLALCLDQGLVDQALDLARSLVERSPAKASAYVLLAELQYKSGDRAGARASYNRALELEPGYLPAYRRSLLDCEEGRFSDAIDLMKKGQEHFPDQPAVALQLAVAQQGSGDAKDALDVLAKALETEGLAAASASVLHWCLAVTYAGMGDAENAHAQNALVPATLVGPPGDRQDLLDHLAGLQDPARSKAATALDLLAIYYRSRSVEAAAAQVTALNDLLPGEPLPACMQADLLDGLGKHQDAITDYRAVIDAHPQYLYARMKLANSLRGTGDTAGAMSMLEDSLALATPAQAAAIHFELGRIYESEGQIDSAIESYKTAMADPGVMPLAANNLAWMLVSARNDPTAALPYARRAAEAAPAAASIADTLGWIYCLTDDVDKAIPELEKARAGMGGTPP